MRYNGVDLRTVHKAISRSKEFPPGMAAREVATLETAEGETVVHVNTARDEYTVRVNISGRTYEEAMEARGRLAAWAASSGGRTARLEPTHAPGKAYDAIVKSIGKLEERFGTVDVVFLLPRPFMYDITPQIRTAASTAEMTLQVGGTAAVQPTISWTPAEDAAQPALALDGETFFALKGILSAGQTLTLDLQTCAVTIDGAHAEDRIVYTDTDPDVEFSPGRHTLTANAEGKWSVRWHNTWL